MNVYDLVILNGEVVDFDNNRLVKTNIAICDGVIKEIGNTEYVTKKTIDATGKIVSPGFVDTHMHEEQITDDGEFDVANHMVLMGVTTAVGGLCGFSTSGSQSMLSFIDHFDKIGGPINYLLYLGYNTVRYELGITDHYTSATQEERIQIAKNIKSLLAKGPIGVSFGLEYDPGITYEEMVEVINNVEEDGLFLTAHFREDAEHSVDSVQELINLSDDTGHKVNISHIGSCAATGYMEASLNVIEEAQERGAQIEVDCYPYNAFSTKIGSAVFDGDWRTKWNKDYSDVLLTEEPYKNVVCTETIFEKVRVEYPDMLVIASAMNEWEVLSALKKPYMLIASDGLYFKGQGHPRGSGTFPRILGKYVREDKEIELIDALRRMTKAPAQAFRLGNKGEIKTSYDADFVIFDQNTIIDNASFNEPTLTPTGIMNVIINGKIAVEGTEIVNGTTGKFVRRSDLDEIV